MSLYLFKYSGLSEIPTALNPLDGLSDETTVTAARSFHIKLSALP
jgi:hypothetical protein